jgi:hypothetical protein
VQPDTETPMILSDHAPKACRLIVQDLQASEVFIYHELSCTVAKIYSSR